MPFITRQRDMNERSASLSKNTTAEKVGRHSASGGPNNNPVNVRDDKRILLFSVYHPKKATSDVFY